jgi:hypothetical protein
MPSKVNTARVCLLIGGWFTAIGAVLFLIVYGLVALGAGSQGEGFISAIFGVVGLVFAIIMGGVAALIFYTAKGIKEQKNWAKILGIVFGVLNILNFPLGTILGALILYGLIADEAADWFQPVAPQQ